MSVTDRITANIENWVCTLDGRITQLDRYANAYKVVNLITVITLAAVTTVLGYLESISLGVEVTDGESNQRIIFSAIKLALIVISTILTSFVAVVNPSKKAGNCFKCAKDYSELRLQLTAKRDKFNLGLYGDGVETLKVYNTFCTAISAKEKVIMEEQTVVTRPVVR
jgi:hypothetical protein